jgi:class 3 adenylate cyclase/alpha-beta hydrolase superfamily lysophospholipase
MDVPHTRYAVSGRAHIAYQAFGEGPDVVLLPHFFHHLELWWEDRFRASFARHLAEFARVILMDKRGTGLSDRTGGVPSFDVQMDDLRAVLDAAHSERAVVVAAGDASPMVLLFAATFPERVNGLVLWNPYPTYIQNQEMPWLMTRPQFEDGSAETTQALQDADGAFLAEVAREFENAADRRAYWRVSRLGTSPGDSKAFASVLAETDVRHILPAIRIPTLVLGDETHPQHDRTARHVAEKIPMARFQNLPKNNRMMFIGDTDSVIATVRDFVEDVATLSRDEPDRVVATVLFTDIVGSTALSAELGNASWRDLLRSHHERVRRELARFRGREIDTAGDGFFATFDGPARAIRCARSVRASILDLGLDIRAGLHAGECEILDGKVTGIAVAIGARVAARAAPGEILVSSTVKDLVAGSGIAFDERGTAELKGVPGQWHLFAVTDDDAAAAATPREPAA